MRAGASAAHVDGSGVGAGASSTHSAAEQQGMRRRGERADSTTHSAAPPELGQRAALGRREEAGEEETNPLAELLEADVADRHDDVPYVRREHLLDALQKRRWRSKQMTALPLQLLYYVLLCVAVLVHLPTQPSFLAERSMIAATVTSTNFASVGDSAAVWQWLQSSFAPAVFVQADAMTGAPLPPRMWGRVAYFNQLIGGIRVTQRRASRRPCDLPAFDQFYGNACYPVDTDSGAPFGLPPPPDTPSSLRMDQAFVPSYDAAASTSMDDEFGDTAPVFQFWLPAAQPLNVSQAQLAVLERRGWLDARTTRVQVSVVTYNGELDNYCLVEFTVSFDRGGSAVPEWACTSIAAQPYASAWVYVLDAVFVVGLVQMVYAVCAKLVSSWRLSRRQAAQRRQRLQTQAMGYRQVGATEDARSMDGDGVGGDDGSYSGNGDGQVQMRAPGMGGGDTLHAALLGSGVGAAAGAAMPTAAASTSSEGGATATAVLVPLSDDGATGGFGPEHAGYGSTDAQGAALGGTHGSGLAEMGDVTAGPYRGVTSTASGHAVHVSDEAAHGMTPGGLSHAPSTTSTKPSSQHRRKNLVQRCTDPWMWIDVASVILLVVNAVQWVLIVVHLTQVAHLMTAFSNQHWVPPTHATPASAGANGSVQDMLLDLLARTASLRVVLYMNLLLMGARVFRFLKFQPRLAVMTKTMGAAAKDLLHFGSIFLFVVTTFAVCGFMLFGQQVESYSTLGKAMTSCLRMLMYDYNLDALVQVDQTAALIYYWVFMIVVMSMMMNMLLAIVLDSYSAVKESTSYAPTIVEELALFIRDRRKSAKEARRAQASKGSDKTSSPDPKPLTLAQAAKVLERGELKDEMWLSEQQLRDVLRLSKPLVNHLIEELEEEEETLASELTPTLERLMKMMLVADQRTAERFAQLDARLLSLSAMVRTRPPQAPAQADGDAGSTRGSGRSRRARATPTSQE